MTAGAKRWTVTTVEKTQHVERACRNKKSKDKGSRVVNRSDTAKKKRHVCTVKHNENRVSDSSEEVSTAAKTLCV